MEEERGGAPVAAGCSRDDGDEKHGAEKLLNGRRRTPKKGTVVSQSIPCVKSNPWSLLVRKEALTFHRCATS